MHKLMPLMMFMGLALASFASATPAHAQAPRTWVSRVGNDGNPCSTTAPCRTFAGAIAKTAVNGEINCVDAGGFDMVTITKSITIDCHDVFASILNSGANGINILFDNFAATDTRKTVRLRNLNINGLAAGLIGINITGATNAANSAVFIEDCLVDGMFAGAKRGISDTRSAGELSIANTTVRNIGGTAIVIAPVDGAQRLEATLDGVRAQNAELGVAIGRPARVLINRSLISGHTTSGIEADGGVELHIDHSTIVNNGAGVRAGGGAIVRLSNNSIAFNRTGIAGATMSFGNNRISGNTTAGTAPTAAGATSTEFGQQ
jgi:parallel beta helix pectate lyase-like protein